MDADTKMIATALPELCSGKLKKVEKDIGVLIHIKILSLRKNWHI